jgi:AraC-like DNA-binding protein
LPLVAGREVARARGRKGGRRKALETLRPDQLERAKELCAARNNSIAEIIALTGFKSRNTFYKYVVNVVSHIGVKIRDWSIIPVGAFR